MFFFFFNDTATTEIYPLSLHDALPIFVYADGRYQVKGVPDRALGFTEIAARAYSGELPPDLDAGRSEEHTSELQSQSNLVCRLLLEKKKQKSRHLYM